MVRRQALMIDAIDDGKVRTARRRRDQDAFGAGIDVHCGLVLGREYAGAFHDDIDAHVAPGRLARIAYGADLDGSGADIDGIALLADLFLIGSVRRVVANRCANISVAAMSFMAATSMSLRPLSAMARRMLRPMRPNPEMATLTVIERSPLRICGGRMLRATRGQALRARLKGPLGLVQGADSALPGR